MLSDRTQSINMYDYFAKHHKNVAITLGNTTATDAFGRLRVSEPSPIFDSTTQYDTQPLLWDTIQTGAGTAESHVPEESGVEISVTSLTEGAIARQTREYFRYQPGLSKLSLISGIIGTPKAGIIRRVGNFDSETGVFFEVSQNGYYVVRRDGGVDVERVAQANWNGDKFDGSGAQGFVFNGDNTNIEFIDFEWLGVGRVRLGAVYNGEFITAHTFINANTRPGAYMTTANLPIRYEVEADGTNLDDDFVLAICATVLQEGRYDDTFGFPFHVSNNSTLRSVTSAAYVPVLAIRPKATFNSIENRGKISLGDFSVFAESQNIHYQLIYGGTVTGGSWASVDDNSIVEYNVTGTAITNGHAIDENYVAASTLGTNASSSASDKSIASKLPITLDASGGNPTEIIIAIKALGTTTDAGATIGWTEIR